MAAHELAAKTETKAAHTELVLTLSLLLSAPRRSIDFEVV